MAKILIIDDEPHIRLLYSEELAEDGHQVETASDGCNLLEKIKKIDPDLVILDVKLAKHDGLELLLSIRNHYYNLPVILCTAYAVFKQNIKSLAADYYVVKSFDLSELKRKIDMALEAAKLLKNTLPSRYALVRSSAAISVLES